MPQNAYIAASCSWSIYFSAAAMYFLSSDCTIHCSLLCAYIYICIIVFEPGTRTISRTAYMAMYIHAQCVSAASSNDLERID